VVTAKTFNCAGAGQSHQFRSLGFSNKNQIEAALKNKKAGPEARFNREGQIVEGQNFKPSPSE
jgi:hypothetical protein